MYCIAYIAIFFALFSLCSQQWIFCIPKTSSCPLLQYFGTIFWSPSNWVVPLIIDNIVINSFIQDDNKVSHALTYLLDNPNFPNVANFPSSYYIMQPKDLSEMIINFVVITSKCGVSSLVSLCPFTLQTLANVMFATRHSCVAVHCGQNYQILSLKYVIFSRLIHYFVHKWSIFFISKLQRLP